MKEMLKLALQGVGDLSNDVRCQLRA